MVNLTGSPDHLFSRRSQCLSEAAFTIWLDCAPFCFRLSFAVRARQVRRARGSASPGGWSRISRRDHVTYSASPARPRCGEGGRAGRDIPGRSVTEAGPGELPHQSPLKHHPGCSPGWCKGTVGASPSVPPCRGHGRGTRAPGQSSLNVVKQDACRNEWLKPIRPRIRPRAANPRGQLARQRGQPSVPRMALREVE